MSEELLEKLKEMKEMIPEAFGKKASEQEIIEAEKQLGGRLPEEYRDFLKEIGGGGVGGAIIMGLSSALFVPTQSIVTASIQFRRKFLEYKDLIVIGIDGSGNFIGFSLGTDKTIFTHDHNFGGYLKIADNFNDYVERALNRELDIAF